jgi:hypothetical protein
MSYVILRGPWCHIIILNFHAPTEGKVDDVKDSFYEDMEISVPKYAGKTFLNRQLALPHLKTSESKVQCFHITSSINTVEFLQMEKPTIRLTIF